MYDYSPLWETLKKKNFSQYYLLTNGIDYRTLDQLRNNRNVTVKTLDKICQLLDCSLDDIVRITKDAKPPKKKKVQKEAAEES